MGPSACRARDTLRSGGDGATDSMPSTVDPDPDEFIIPRDELRRPVIRRGDHTASGTDTGTRRGTAPSVKGRGAVAFGLNPSAVFDVVDLTGVVANGILGGVVARSLKLDAVGFVFLSIITALGGGLMRDTLLNVGQPVALTNPLYMVCALAGAAVAYFVPMHGRWTQRVLVVADSLSLGCWAATGTSKALGADVWWLPALFIGLLTAVGGGMIRDLLVGRIPAILGGNTLYATGALLGSVEMAVFWHLGLPTWGMAVSIVTAAVLTILARRYRWTLPGPAVWLEDFSVRRIPQLLRRRRAGGAGGVPVNSDTATAHTDDVEALGGRRQRLTPTRLMRLRRGRPDQH